MKKLPLEISLNPDTLFNYSEENEIYSTKGIEAYKNIQSRRVKEPAPPGPGFNLVVKLLALNTAEQECVRINIVNAADPLAVRRTITSLDYYKLNSPAALPPTAAPPSRESLFLSNNIIEVAAAYQKNNLAAYVSPCNENKNLLKIALDQNYITTYYKPENRNSYFNNFMEVVNELKKAHMNIRIGLILETGLPAAKETFKNFMHKEFKIDEVFFVQSTPKKNIIERFTPDIYFHYYAQEKIGAPK